LANKSDELNITLLRRSTNKKTGGDVWSVKGYYATLGGAIGALVDNEIKSTELIDLQTIYKKLRN
jgi:hypothetical protein